MRSLCSMRGTAVTTWLEHPGCGLWQAASQAVLRRHSALQSRLRVSCSPPGNCSLPYFLNFAPSFAWCAFTCGTSVELDLGEGGTGEDGLGLLDGVHLLASGCLPGLEVLHEEVAAFMQAGLATKVLPNYA